MKKIIKGWKHYRGIHCGSGAIKDICNFHGYNFSEELCFGLGAGLGFYYTKDNEVSPSRSIHVRGPLMETNFFNNFGLEYKDWKYEEDNERAFITLKEYIDQDIPVLIQTDIYYLDYYNSSTHFPGHIVVVCGYDDEERCFYLSDTSFNQLQSVSYEKMASARCSKFKPNPLSNNWFEVNLRSRDFNIKEAVEHSIYLNAKMMVEGFTTLRGKSSVETIKDWAVDLPDWQFLPDWQWACRFSYQVISKRGVEGAAFRWIYRDFLKEVSNINLKIETLDLARKMDLSGRKWFEVSALLKETSEGKISDRKLIKTSQLVNEIYTIEKDYYDIILENFSGIN
ncbi:MAG: BtrH N-terminal domain-containing protein [Thermodesulfobacteriota bacterium]